MHHAVQYYLHFHITNITVSHLIYHCRILVNTTADLKTFHPKCIKNTEYLFVYMKSREGVTCDAETNTLYSFIILSKCFIIWYSFHWMHHTFVVFIFLQVWKQICPRAQFVKCPNSLLHAEQKNNPVWHKGVPDDRWKHPCPVHQQVESFSHMFMFFPCSCLCCFIWCIWNNFYVGPCLFKSDSSYSEIFGFSVPVSFLQWAALILHSSMINTV
jgi:hypothetical protein